MTTKTKTLLLNVIFHFMILGFGVRLLFYPEMPDGHWLGLVFMTFVMRPIVAYFYGWNMTLRGTVGDDAPKFHRLSLLVILVTAYIVSLLIWLGVVDHLHN